MARPIEAGVPLRIGGLLFAAALLSSCGSSGGGDGGGGGVSTPTTFLFFTGGANAALGAVDPANAAPAGLITVEPSAATIAFVNPVYGGSYDAATLRISGVHHHAVTYLKTVAGAQQLFKVSALTGAVPAPARVSSASFVNSGATTLCTIAVYSDYANPDNGRVVYTQAGPDASCGGVDNPLSIASLSMNSGTAPLAGPAGGSVIRELRDGGGAISGWVVLVGTSLRWYQADMAAFQALGAVTTVSWLASGTGREFFAIDAGGGPQVRIFDGTATLKNPGGAATALTASFDCKADDTYLFCADTTAAGRTIRRLPLDGSATWTVIYAGFTEVMTSIVLSENRVLFTDAQNASFTDLSSVPKAPFDPQSVFPDLVCRSGALALVLASGSRVYCTEDNSGAFRATHIHEDGQNEVLITDASATLMGWAGQSGSVRDVNNFQRTERVLLMSESSAGLNRLTAYDGPSGVVLADLVSAVLAGFNIPNFAAVLADTNNGNTLVLLADSNNGNNSELFFANNATSNSLTRLTTSTASSEAFVGASCSIGSGQSPDPVLPLMVVIALLYILRRGRRKVP